MSDHLTILTSAAGQRLGKSFVGTSFAEGRFSAGGKFHVSEVAVDGLVSLSVALRAMETRTDQVVIRGRQSGLGAGPVRRTKDFFQPANRQWCMLDIDRLEGDGTTSDPLALVALATKHLPVEFHGVDCWYQFSSSMGIKSGIRVHLWYWLDRACSDDEMRVWLNGCPVDPRLFNSIQMHLTAAPEFKDGAVDPFPKRSGLFSVGQGKDTVGVPVDLTARSQVHVVANRPRGRTKSNQLDPVEVVRDPKTGLAIDGREALLFQLSNEVTAALTTQNYQPTVDEISDALWTRFQEEADLTVCNGRTWTKADAKQKATARKRELDAGTFSFLAKSDKTMLLPGYAAAPRPYLINALVAKKELDFALGGFFDRLSKGKIPRTAIRITMGVGKTRATIDKLKDYLQGRWGQLVEIYVPRHHLGDEWFEKLQDDAAQVNAEVIHVLPRTGGKFIAEINQYEHPVLCERADYVRELENKGHAVYGNACLNKAANARCKFFDDCKYLDQFREAKNPGSNIIRIYTHSSLFLGRNEFERQQVPNLVIIDEGFLASAVSDLPMVSSSDILAYLRTEDKKNLGFELLECLKSQKGQFSYLEQKGIDISDFKGISLEALNPKPAFSPDATTAQSLRSGRVYKMLRKVLDVVIDELKDSERTGFEQLVYDPHEDGVVVCEHRKIRISRSTPVLYLDATAHPLVTEVYLPGMEMHRVDVHQLAVVSQVWDRTGSNSFWNGKIKEEEANLEAKPYDIGHNDLSALVNILNEWAQLGEKPLLVGHKGLSDCLREHPKLDKAVQVAHFNSLRGSNAYEDCSVIFVTGRNQPPFEVIERQAKSVFGSSSIPLAKDDTKDLPLQQVDYWLSHRSPHSPSGVLVPTFSDPRVQAVLQQIREAETLQVIARLRLVRTGYQKRVFLLSNLPVEMPIDHLIEFDDLRPDRLELELIKVGDLPLTGLGLERMRPDLGYFDAAARMAIGRSKASDPKALLKQLPTLRRNLVQIATFKAGDKRKTEHTHLFLPKGYDGDPVVALYSPWTEQEAHDHLEKGWGEGAVIDLRLGFLYGA